VLPWGAQKETVKPQQMGDMDLRPGEYVMRILFAEFTSQAEKKMEAVMTEHVSLSLKSVHNESQMLIGISFSGKAIIESLTKR